MTDRAIADLKELEADEGLRREDALNERVEALEQLAFLLELLRTRGPQMRALAQRAARLRQELEACNRRYFAQVRRWLVQDAPDPAEVRALLARHSRYGQPDDPRLHLDYEPVDTLVDGVLQLDRFTGRPTVEDPDLVHLEDTPVRVLFDLVDHIGLERGDWFYDLGSGLGRAAIVVHWLTGAPIRGVEIQPDYCAFARRLAASFGLEAVTFEQADARYADLSKGTVYYLYTPFKGRILRTVLDRLRGEAQQRPLTVCTYGTVSLVVAREPWLRPLSSARPHEYALEIFRSS